MSVREFNGSTDRLTLDDGTMGAVANAAWSFVLLVEPTSLAADQSFISLNSGTGTVKTFYDHGSGGMGAGGDTGGDSFNIATGLTASAWQVIGVSKASGTVVARFHRKVLGSGSWTHLDGSGTIANVATDIDNVKVGTFGDSTGAKPMRLAVAAFFTSNLTDSDFVNIDSNATTAFLQTLTPTVLWEFNQASTGTNVTDAMGTGADQTSITGTTVVEGDDPAWTFLPTSTPASPDLELPQTGNPGPGLYGPGREDRGLGLF